MASWWWLGFILHLWHLSRRICFPPCPSITYYWWRVGIVLKNNIKAKIQAHESYCSFEHLELELRATKYFVRLIVLYRPPSSDVSLFFDEFASYLANIVMASGYLLIFGDFNFHVDSQNNAGRRFTGLLHSFNLRQHVNDSTHKNGHTLDLVITREEQSFIKNLWSLILHFLIILWSGVIWIFVNILLKIKCHLFDV